MRLQWCLILALALCALGGPASWTPAEEMLSRHARWTLDAHAAGLSFELQTGPGVVQPERKAGEQDQAARMQAAAARRGNTAVAAGFECLIEPYQVVEIRSAVEGLIEKVNVKRGDPVRKGQVLVQLVADVDRATAESAKYRSQVEGRIEAAKSRIELSTKKLKRFDELSDKNFVSKQQHDEARAEKQLAEAELKDAIENRESARLEYQRAAAQLNLRTLTSPFDGIVVERMLNPGDLAESGTGRKPMLKLAQIDPLRVEVVLPLSAHGKIQVGSTADVVPEGGYEKQSAKVSVADKVLDAASGTFGVRLDLPNPRQKLPAGIRCHANFPGVNAEPLKGKPARVRDASQSGK